MCRRGSQEPGHVNHHRDQPPDRLIRAHPLYEFVRPRYGLDPALYEPCIDGAALRFAVVRSYLFDERRSHMAEVRLDLRTMAHDVRILAYRRGGPQ